MLLAKLNLHAAALLAKSVRVVCDVGVVLDLDTVVLDLDTALKLCAAS